jgi:DNA-binding MarR family transcriptional regulator
MHEHDATRVNDGPEPRRTHGGVPPEPPDARTAWHRLLQVSSRVLAEMDRRLDANHRLSVNEFDVLITLDNAEGHMLRMTDLAHAVMLSSGGLTRLVSRLQQAGLVQREPNAEDARGLNASLTDAGRARLAEARCTHDAVVDNLLGSRVTQSQIATLSRLLGRVLEPTPPSPVTRGRGH